MTKVENVYEILVAEAKTPMQKGMMEIAKRLMKAGENEDYHVWKVREEALKTVLRESFRFFTYWDFADYNAVEGDSKQYNTAKASIAINF